VRANLVRAYPPLTVIEAGDADEARRLIDRHRPDVVLVDLRLGEHDGLDLIRYLHDHHPDTHVLVLSQAPLPHVVTAIRAGARGYVSKSAGATELVKAVVSVQTGPVLPAELAAVIIGEFQQAPTLTQREREVLRSLAKGYDNHEIAGELGIAVRTVNRHLESIRDKLGTRRRSELMRVAREWTTG
jgi:DNA-binding NarL/FixJ family response regulator